MFHITNRRYTGAKTKLLQNIDSALSKNFDYESKKNLRFFDVFGGTGVVSAYFMQKAQFSSFIINDFLYSNYAIYQGFFAKQDFDVKKIKAFKEMYQNLKDQNLQENYYSRHFGGKFFSVNDSKIVGKIREDLDKNLKAGAINQKEFYILLASLLYSVDKIANTVGHYDAYRKNVSLCDKFHFECIKPLQNKAKIEIFRQDSNQLVKDLIHHKKCIDIAFIDPPYNSRQYSRFYHLLETLSKNDKPKLYGIALKPKPENMSSYCKTEATKVLKDLIENLAKISKILVLTYNNTYHSKSSSSQNKIQLNQIQKILKAVGKTSSYEFDFKAFSSGKTELRGHKEMIFVGKIQ